MTDQEPRPLTTREADLSLTVVRVLRSASLLFAAQGYDATTAGDVAAHSGVPEAEVLELFPTTAAMMQALFDHDVDDALTWAEAEAAGEGPAVVRLYRYLAKDFAWVLGSPYDLSGIDRVKVLTRPEFAPWREKLERLRALRLEMVKQAIADGDFINVAPEFAQEAITTVIMGTIDQQRERFDEDPDARGAELAAFALRSLLRKPKRIDDIRRQAAASGDADPGSA